MERRVLWLESGELAGHHIVVWADGSARISRALARSELASVLAENSAVDVTPHPPAHELAARPPRSRLRPRPHVPDWMRVI